MKSKANVSHDGLGITSELVREITSIPQLLTYQERVYSDVMDMELKEDEVAYKIDKTDKNESQDLKENFSKLLYKKKLFCILLEQIKLRIEIVKASNYNEECKIFKDVARENISPEIYKKISEQAKVKFKKQPVY